MICCRVNRRDSSSGFGFELTFRLKKQVGETSPPSWPAELLQSLARYVFQTGKDIKLSCKSEYINCTVGLEVSRVKVSLGLGKVKSVLTHLAGAYLGLHVAWSDHKFYYSSLNRVLVHYKVTSPHSHSISSGFLENLLILMGGERHCLRTQHIDSSRCQMETSPPGVQCTDHWATAPSTVYR